MLFWIILIIIIVVLILFFLWWFNFISFKDFIESNSIKPTLNKLNSQESGIVDPINYPTIHAYCQSDSACGGDLICDINCKRCKKKFGGNCSSNVDCEFGLDCYNWKCVPTINEQKQSENLTSMEINQSEENNLSKSSNEKHKIMHRDDTNNNFLKTVRWDDTNNNFSKTSNKTVHWYDTNNSFSKTLNKTVHWDDTKNNIYYI